MSCVADPDATLLVVFDESGSMNDPWMGGPSKLAVAREGVSRALAALPVSARIGALFYPTLACIPFLPPPEGGVVAAIDTAPQIGFRDRGSFIAAWNAKWLSAGEPSGVGTPLQETLDRVEQAIAGMEAREIDIVLISDGSNSNCFTGSGGGPDGAWPADGVSLVQAWSARGHSVHVIALALASTEPTDVDMFAAAAGNSTIIPTDAHALADALGAVACAD